METTNTNQTPPAELSTNNKTSQSEVTTTNQSSPELVSATTTQASESNTSPTAPAADKSSTTKFIGGNLCILIATIFWGINVSFTKALIPQWMSSEGISAVRLVGGAILFWIGSIFVKNAKIDRSDWKNIIAGGIFGLFGFIWLFVMSLKFANPIDVSIIMTLPPTFVILIGIIFQHQRPSLLEYIGVLIGLAGAVTVILGAGHGGADGSNDILGDCLAILSCICYASYLVILEGPTKKYHPMTLLRWVFGFAAIPGLFLLIGFNKQGIWHAQSAEPWLLISFILFCVTFIAYFLVQPAIKSIGSELVSIYQYLLPVFATITAVIMKLDKLHWIQVLAMAIIVVGMVIVNIGKKKRKNNVALQKN